MFALSQDLGTIQSTANPIVWAVGYTRDPALLYTDLSGNAQNRGLYYQANFTNIGDLVGLYPVEPAWHSHLKLSMQIDNFLDDFPAAIARATQLDTQIVNDALAAVPSSNYVDIISISARQAYGATELTVGKGTDGKYNQSDVMMFMKNIGGTATKYIIHSRQIIIIFHLF